MDNSNMDDFNKFEEETKLELIRLEQSTNNSNAKSIIHTITAELEKWFSEVRQFIDEHKDSEKVKDTVNNVKEETLKVIEKIKDKVNDVKDDDKVKDFIDSTVNNLENLRDSINENETYIKVKESVYNTFENIKNDENVKQGVNKVKKTTLSFAKKALTKVEKALQDDDEIIIHTIKKENEEE